MAYQCDVCGTENDSVAPGDWGDGTELRCAECAEAGSSPAADGYMETDDEWYQVEAKIDPPGEWQRNGQRHPTQEKAEYAASIFSNASDVAATRVVRIHARSQRREEIVSI